MIMLKCYGRLSLSLARGRRGLAGTYNVFSVLTVAESQNGIYISCFYCQSHTTSTLYIHIDIYIYNIFSIYIYVNIPSHYSLKIQNIKLYQL